MQPLSGVRDRKEHYPALDGLRGFAALCVLAYHLGHWLHWPALATNSGLAVDLFFCLSGFVLPLAYRRHAGDRPLGWFLKTRLVRLMPLIVLAIAISAPYVFLRTMRSDAGVPYAALVQAVVLGLVNLPFPGAPMTIGGPQIFPLNGPQYTLFLELAANLVWWATRRIDPLTLALTLAILCLCLLPFVGLGGDVPATFWSGFPRVGASFFAGVALFHMKDTIPDRGGATCLFWILVFVMGALFFAPVPVPLPIALLWVAVVSPLLVLSGSRARLSPGLDRLCRFGGALSYPLYALHYPIFCWINGIYQARGHAANILVEGPLVVAVVLIVSLAALKLYDEPVRAMLALRLRRREPRQAIVASQDIIASQDQDAPVPML